EGANVQARFLSSLVPKLCLGTSAPKLCFAGSRISPFLAQSAAKRREAELRTLRSQAELGNEILAGLAVCRYPMPRGRGGGHRAFARSSSHEALHQVVDLSQRGDVAGRPLCPPCSNRRMLVPQAGRA